MPTYLVRHVTTYRYARPVAFGEHRMMLLPRDGHDQRTRSARVAVSPEPLATSWSDDGCGNLVGRACFIRPAAELRIDATLEVDVTPFDLEAPPGADRSPARPPGSGGPSGLGRFAARQHPDPDGVVERWAEAILHEDPARDSFDAMRRMSARIRAAFAYRRRLERGLQAPALTLALGTGSCRDFAVLMAEAARSLGLAARFASGYLHVPAHRPDVAAMSGHTHAWLQVFLPGAGWVDFDPSSGTVGNRGLVRVALVRDPAEASPLSGSYFGAPEDFVDMSVGVVVSELRRSDHSRRRNGPEAAAA